VTAPGWPATLVDGAVVVRPPKLRDALTWVDLRVRNEAWLAPWEATPPTVEPLGPWAERQTVTIYSQMVRRLRRQARQGGALPFLVARRDEERQSDQVVGQITVSTIVRGAANTGQVGYWIDEAVAGRGIMPTALALVVGHCLGPVGLHRIEANVRPENVASRRVVEKLGFREEGLHLRYLAIDGAYRDHIVYAITTEDVPEGIVSRWRAVRAAREAGL
jgi:[ribosomal protein S5]-alanine N-acetyltransferase